jgi:hypothetical protein
MSDAELKDALQQRDQQLKIAKERAAQVMKKINH